MAALGIILMDVDGTVSCGRSAPNCRARPGMHDTLIMLTALGFEVVFWSAGGGDHAQEVAEHLGYPVRRFFGKPDHPMSADDVIARLGEAPVMQVDDEHQEKVGDWPFFLIDGWYGEMTRTESGLLVPLPDDAIEAMGWNE